MSVFSAFIVGSIAGSIVSYIVISAIIAGETSDKHDIYRIGYDTGFRDGLKKKGD